MRINIKYIGVILFLYLCLSSLISQAETLTGKVINIADGDTLTILTVSNVQVKIRLAGIDTPEKAQPFGAKATQALAALVLQKQVTVDVETIDRYGRTVGKVIVNGLDINAELVKKGMAWVYRRYTNDEKLYALESNAKKEKLGLWSSNNFIEPWLWRRGARK